MDSENLETHKGRSSAYSETLCFSPFLWMPEIQPSPQSAMARGSIARANRRGLRGQPCLLDRWSGKYSDWLLLVLTKAKGVEYNNLTQETNVAGGDSSPGHYMALPVSPTTWIEGRYRASFKNGYVLAARPLFLPSPVVAVVWRLCNVLKCNF